MKTRHYMYVGIYVGSYFEYATHFSKKCSPREILVGVSYSKQVHK